MLNTPIADWTVFTTAWAEVQDYLPRQAERVADVINLAARPTRISTLYLNGITSAMRVRIGGVGGRILQIIVGPAELGNREGMEFVAQETSTIGEAA